MNRRTPVIGGRIRGRIRTKGFVLRTWWQFIGIVTELDEDRIVLEDIKRIEINTETGELDQFNLSIGDRVGITMGDNDELYLLPFPRVKRARHRIGIIRA